MSKQYPGGIISKTPVTPSGAYENSTASGIWTLDQQAYWQELGQWPTAGNVQPDPQFNYVTMLLHADGTNGAQNNTFLDSSGNNYTITRTGNTTQGSFSPYGANWSNYFNGTSTLAFPSNSAFAFDTGAYTVEMWVFVTGVGSGGFSHFFNAGNATGSFGFAIYSDYSLNVFGYGTGGVITGSANDITPNQWQHIAVCRSSTSSNATKIYVNGVLKTTGTDSTNWTVTTTPAVGGITNLTGYSTVGYISNCRVVKGTAVYTAAFTPPTAPLTAISGTSLLTCQSNRFIDNSVNNFAITVNDSTNVQRFNPFGTSTAYSTSVIGGSGYFDRSDYLTMPANTATTLGTGDFTIECWVYGFGGGDYRRAFWFQYNSSNSGSGLSVERYTDNGSTTLYALNYPGGQITNTNARGGIYAWNHIAVVRLSGNIRFYINGILQGSAADTSNYTVGSAPLIGNAYEGGSIRTDAWDGYISDFRLVKGTAVYTFNFTPPTAPLTAISGTSILASMTNGAIFDNAMISNLETVGNAQISTSVVKYGTGSLYFDGTGDGLFLPSASALTNMSFKTGDFTVEFWINLAANLGSFVKIVQMGTTGNCFTIETQSTTNVLNITNFTSTVYLASSTALTNSTWIHVAVTRASGTLYIFQNGIQTGSVANTVDFVNGNGIYIGQSSTGQAMNGYIDDLRITRGYARYTTTFTPPTSAFPNIGPT